MWSKGGPGLTVDRIFFLHHFSHYAVWLSWLGLRLAAYKRSPLPIIVALQKSFLSFSNKKFQRKPSQHRHGHFRILSLPLLFWLFHPNAWLFEMPRSSHGPRWWMELLLSMTSDQEGRRREGYKASTLVDSGPFKRSSWNHPTKVYLLLVQNLVTWSTLVESEAWNIMFSA